MSCLTFHNDSQHARRTAGDGGAAPILLLVFWNHGGRSDRHSPVAGKARDRQMPKSAPAAGDAKAEAAATTTMPGAEVLLKALEDEGVEVVFGYPGGAVLPI